MATLRTRSKRIMYRIIVRLTMNNTENQKQPRKFAYERAMEAYRRLKLEYDSVFRNLANNE